MQKIFALIGIVTVLAILTIAILLNPNKTNSLIFWGQLGWFIFLAILNLLVSGAFFSSGKIESKHSKKSIAILPSLNILVLIYSIISATLLLTNISLISSFVNQYHLVLQIAFSAIFIILGLLIYMASKGAEVNLPNNKRREDLLHDLKSIGLNLELSDDSLFIDLVEQIKYKMPHPSSIDKNLYNEIVEDIIELSQTDSVDNVKHKLDEILKKIKASY